MSEPFSKHNKAQVWSCGGGTQSCAIAALIVQGKLPKPDFSVIADTGYETRATWEYMDAVLVPELRKVGVELTRITVAEFGGKAKGDLFWPGLDIPQPLIPAFTTQFGSVGKMSNFCTGKWKVEPVERWGSKAHGITESMIVRWIGFSRDEQTRIVRMQAGKVFKDGGIRFPLVELGFDRRSAIKLVEDMGWPTPPRSACWMCPNKSDHEWRLEIKERPDEFAKACELEREIHKVDPDAWLHRSCVPLDQVDFSQPEDLFSRPCDSGMCFV
jgi:hypothetical protein